VSDCIGREDFDEAVKEQNWEWLWSVVEYFQNCGMTTNCPRCGFVPAPSIEKIQELFVVLQENLETPTMDFVEVETADGKSVGHIPMVRKEDGFTYLGPFRG
jgi:hypothetical protein